MNIELFFLSNNIMTKNNFENTKKVNGPLSAYRMEGSVNGQKKVLYLFADQHVMTHRCSDAVSLDIDQYIVREFNKINESSDSTEYDLFVETYPDIVMHEATRSTSSYLGELRVAFSKYIDYDKQTNKMTISKFGKKSRLHYIDMRNNIIVDIIHIHDKDVMHGFQVFDRNILKMSMENIISKIMILLSHLHDYGFHGKKSAEKLVMTDFINKTYDHTKSDEYLKKIIHKIINQYNDKKIKEIINRHMTNITSSLEQITQELIDMFKKLDEFWIRYDEISNKLDHSGRGLYGMSYDELKSQMDKWAKQYTDIYLKFLTSTSQIMDFYFLRRFLDKSYVTNGIVYTGAFHTMDIIHILINEFDFQLTHSSVEKFPISDLNKKIKKINYDDFYPEIKSLLYPEYFGQCVDLTNFPESYH